MITQNPIVVKLRHRDNLMYLGNNSISNNNKTEKTAGLSNFASKLGQIGIQIGQIWDFLRSVSVHFGSGSQNVLKLIFKSPKFVPFGANLTHFGATADSRGCLD